MKLNYTIEKYKDRATWLKERQKSFGGSSVSALLGKNRYLTAIDLYCSSVNPSEEKKENNTASTIYGRNVEKTIATLFQINYPQYKVSYPKVITMMRRKDYNFMSYTPDSLLQEIETKRKGFLEIKSHEIQNSEDAMMWANGQLPEQYYIQVLQGFNVMNDKEFCELYAILNYMDYETQTIKYSELRHYHLERNQVEDDIKLIEKVQIDFQTNYIDKHLPPNIHIEL